MESARSVGVPSCKGSTQSADDPVAGNDYFLLNFSANDPEALQAVVQNHETYLKAHPERLKDLCYTLAARRQPLPHRTYALISRNTLTEALKVVPSERVGASKAQLVYVFTGQGAQWAGMGASLIQRKGVFQTTIRQLDRVLESCNPPATWSIIGTWQFPHLPRQ
jgi:acyl transferase domain-containing protein